MISSSIGPCDQLLDLLSYPNLWLSMGYRQIKSEPTIFVMLSYSWMIPRAYTITSLVWPMLSPCSLNYGIPFKKGTRMNCCWAHWQHLYLLHDLVGQQVSVGNFWKHFLHASSWSICLMKGVTSFDSRAFWCKLPSWIRESLFVLLWNHPKMVMHMCEVVYGLVGWPPPFYICS